MPIPPATAPALQETLLGCERAVWDALVAGDAVADAQALHDAFLGVYPSGFATKVDHLAQLADGPSIMDYSLSECRVMALGDDCSLLSYRADYQRAGRDRQEAMFVSSIWRKQANGGWINIFSQDTPAEDATP